jgi:DNA-binding transcriptional ArsR family regulator
MAKSLKREANSVEEGSKDIARALRVASEGKAPPSDRLIHQRTRLAIISMLAVNESLTFNELKHLLETTDGNLSVHARKLEEAGYVDCEKSFEGRIPRTEYRITRQGRRVLEGYLEHMERLIQAVRDS